MNVFVLFSSFGYPDPAYLLRVQEELRLKGVTEEEWWVKRTFWFSSMCFFLKRVYFSKIALFLYDVSESHEGLRHLSWFFEWCNSKMRRTVQSIDILKDINCGILPLEFAFCHIDNFVALNQTLRPEQVTFAEPLQWVKLKSLQSVWNLICQHSAPVNRLCLFWKKNMSGLCSRTLFLSNTIWNNYNDNNSNIYSYNY